MDSRKDYYGILGVLPSAENIVIRAAYKALAQRYHPDRFSGPPDEANRRVAAINEAYEVLTDPRNKAEYDRLRGHGTAASDEYFGGDGSENPPPNDPLAEDWSVALLYYPDLQGLSASLSKISWRLAFAFRAYLLAEKKFEQRMAIADGLERDFLESYFGTNPEIVDFARSLIWSGNRDAAKNLNEAIRVLGSEVDPQRIISRIRAEYKTTPPSEALLMRKFGIEFVEGKYRYREYSYTNLQDAINYAELDTIRNERART